MPSLLATIIQYRSELSIRRGLVIQEDGVPRTAGTPDIMSGCQPGTLYLDTRQLAIPYYQRDGDYTLQLVVYQWRDGVRLVPTDPAQAGMAVTADHALILNSMHLLSYAVWGVP